MFWNSKRIFLDTMFFYLTGGQHNRATFIPSTWNWTAAFLDTLSKAVLGFSDYSCYGLFTKKNFLLISSVETKKSPKHLYFSRSRSVTLKKKEMVTIFFVLNISNFNSYVDRFGRDTISLQIWILKIVTVFK